MQLRWRTRVSDAVCAGPFSAIFLGSLVGEAVVRHTFINSSFWDIANNTTFPRPFFSLLRFFSSSRSIRAPPTTQFSMASNAIGVLQYPLWILMFGAYSLLLATDIFYLSPYHYLPTKYVCIIFVVLYGLSTCRYLHPALLFKH